MQSLAICSLVPLVWTFIYDFILFSTLKKRTNAGLSIIKQVGIRVQGVRSLTSRTPPALPDPIRSIYVEGRLNAARVIVPDLVSSNGVVQIVDTMLIPPTAELGLSILDRIARTPWLSIYEEIILVLGLQPVGKAILNFKALNEQRHMYCWFPIAVE